MSRTHSAPEIHTEQADNGRTYYTASNCPGQTWHSYGLAFREARRQEAREKTFAQTEATLTRWKHTGLEAIAPEIHRYPGNGSQLCPATDLTAN